MNSDKPKDPMRERQERPKAARPARDAMEGRGSARGRSGYGVESLRPHLREQLALKELLAGGSPMTQAKPRG
ncbi:hypothetical protein [Ramlibacter rhizophilus]|uniref:Uncharacterized protein n=1 Tax=Ramlibacter rhizophilus TaxID=1781167 RepID=A0A4Z0BGA3_9BURK|nr:hypothetical protein [Ramlibacter rhizophilus]TFY96928.1 hypothetical protein EZ242_19875 [Ramlibacter rhizophilus]